MAQLSVGRNATLRTRCPVAHCSLLHSDEVLYTVLDGFSPNGFTSKKKQLWPIIALSNCKSTTSQSDTCTNACPQSDMLIC